MMRRKGLSEDDLALWAAYSRTLSRLLPGRSRLPVPAHKPVAPSPIPVPTPEPPKINAAGLLARLEINATPGGVDKSTWAKFRAQKTRVQARLDLHGHTVARAHCEVLRFLEMAVVAELRCVEIITGNGESLARELPHWLNAPAVRPFILGLAHPHARNSGSVRVLLRRRRLT